MSIDNTSEEDFARLLAWLGPDQERAVEKYEHIRQSLQDYFRRREALDPLSLADEVIARVTKNAIKVSTNYVGDPAHYFLAVARNVLAEWRRQPVAKELPEQIAAQPEHEVNEFKELMLQGLEECWTILSTEEQELLSRYCLGTSEQKISESREELARELGVTLNALRVTTHRLRNRLKHCIEKSVAKKEREIVFPILHS